MRMLTDLPESIKMGTTVGTNALLERKGEKTALVVTKGLKDMLHIGNQSRPKLFDLAINKPDVLYSKVVEVAERVTLEAWTECKNLQQININSDPALVQGITGEVVRIVEPLGLSVLSVSNRVLTGNRYRSCTEVTARNL